MTLKTGLPSINLFFSGSFTQVGAVIGDVWCPLRYAQMRPCHFGPVGSSTDWISRELGRQACSWYRIPIAPLASLVL